MLRLLRAVACACSPSVMPRRPAAQLPKHSDPIHLLRVSMDQLGRAVHGETLEVEVAGAEEGQAPDTAAPAAGEVNLGRRHAGPDLPLRRCVAGLAWPPGARAWLPTPPGPPP